MQAGARYVAAVFLALQLVSAALGTRARGCAQRVCAGGCASVRRAVRACGAEAWTACIARSGSPDAREAAGRTGEDVCTRCFPSTRPRARETWLQGADEHWGRTCCCRGRPATRRERKSGLRLTWDLTTLSASARALAVRAWSGPGSQMSACVRSLIHTAPALRNMRIVRSRVVRRGAQCRALRCSSLCLAIAVDSGCL